MCNLECLDELDRSQVHGGSKEQDPPYVRLRLRQPRDKARQVRRPGLDFQDPATFSIIDFGEARFNKTG
jgi:hypothetical protein